MKAKDDARNTGTWPRVTIWKISVPIPAVNSATPGFSPVRSGTSTSAPKATNSIWAPISACFGENLYAVSWSSGTGLRSLVAVIVWLIFWFNRPGYSAGLFGCAAGAGTGGGAQIAPLVNGKPAFDHPVRRRFRLPRARCRNSARKMPVFCKPARGRAGPIAGGST